MDLWVTLTPYRLGELDEESEPRLLLEGVSRFELSYFGAAKRDEEPEWHARWPDDAEALPALVGLVVERPGTRPLASRHGAPPAGRGALMCKRYQRGVALVVVLWIGTIIVLLAGAFAFGTRSENRVIEELRNTTSLRASADAALHYVALTLLEQRANAANQPPEDKIPVNGRPWQWEFAGEILEISVTGTGGLVDLNRAQPALLEEALLFAGLSGGEVKVVRDAIEDSAKNGPFESVKELGAVAGLDRMRMDRLASLMTVYGNAAIDPAQAPFQVLEMLSGGDAQLAADLVEQDNAEVERAIKTEHFAAGGQNSYLVSVVAPQRSRGALTAVISVPGRAGHLYARLE